MFFNVTYSFSSWIQSTNLVFKVKTTLASCDYKWLLKTYKLLIWLMTLLTRPFRPKGHIRPWWRPRFKTFVAKWVPLSSPFWSLSVKGANAHWLSRYSLFKFDILDSNHIKPSFNLNFTGGIPVFSVIYQSCSWEVIILRTLGLEDPVDPRHGFINS